MRFDAELGDEPDPAWSSDIDQVIFRGSWVMEEVVFFHRVSRTAIFGDLIQRHAEEKLSGWKAELMRRSTGMDMKGRRLAELSRVREGMLGMRTDAQGRATGVTGIIDIVIIGIVSAVMP